MPSAKISQHLALFSLTSQNQCFWSNPMELGSDCSLVFGRAAQWPRPPLVKRMATSENKLSSKLPISRSTSASRRGLLYAHARPSIGSDEVFKRKYDKALALQFTFFEQTLASQTIG